MSVLDSIKSFFGKQSKITVRTATFKKSDGTPRKMRFLSLAEMQEAGLMEATAQTRSLKNGQELVYDLDKKGIRTFNNNTVIGKIISERVDARSINL